MTLIEGRLGKSVLFVRVCGRTEVRQNEFVDRPRQHQHRLSGGTHRAPFGDFGAPAKVTRSLIAEANSKCRILASEIQPNPIKTKATKSQIAGKPGSHKRRDTIRQRVKPQLRCQPKQQSRKQTNPYHPLSSIDLPPLLGSQANSGEHNEQTRTDPL